MRIYGGVIVLQPRQVRSFYGRPAATREEWFELSRVETDKILAKLVGKEIRTEHSHVSVGRVVEAGYDKDHNACVRFTLDDTVWAQRTGNLIKDGLLRGLSLCHNPETLEPTEVSLVYQGARPGTFINEIIDTQPVSEMSSGQCKESRPSSSQAAPQQQQVVEASALSVTFTPDAMAQMQRLVTSDGVGMPPPGEAPAGGDIRTFNSMQAAAAALMPPPTAGPARKRFRAPDGTILEEVATDPAVSAGATPTGPPPVAVPTAGAPVAPAATPPAAAAAPSGAAAPKDAAKPTDAAQELSVLKELLGNGGTLDEAKMERLIGLVGSMKSDREQLQQQVQQLRQRMAVETKAAQYQRNMTADHMISVLIPFIRSVMGKNAISPDLERFVSDAVKEPGGISRGFEALGPQLVAASAMSMTQREQAAPFSARVHQAYEALTQGQRYQQSEQLQPMPVQQLQQLTPLPPVMASAGAAPALPSSAYGWVMQQQPQPMVAASGTGMSSAPAQSHGMYGMLQQLSAEMGEVDTMDFKPSEARNRAAQQRSQENEVYLPAHLRRRA